MTERRGHAEPRRREQKKKKAGETFVEPRAGETFVEPRASFEELEIRLADGAVLRAVVDDPPAPAALRGTVVLAHGMFAERSSFGKRGRPGLSHALVARGFRTIAFDFRGHGESRGPERAPRADEIRRSPHLRAEKTSDPERGYDDLIRFDLPAVVGCAQARAEDRPVVVVGHSLGGQVALAAQATGRISVDAIVALATTVWLRELETSTLRWGAKRLIGRAILSVAGHVGRIPLRALRLETDDATSRAIGNLHRVIKDGHWRSADGAEDYLSALAQVKIPVAGVFGDEDRVLCDPASGEAFVRRCGGALEIFEASAGHTSLLTSERGQNVILDAVEWALAASARKGR